MTEFDSVKDSGDRTNWDTGSRRDVKTGKGRYDLIPPYFVKRLAQHLENGAVKYGDRNWELGQPLGNYLDSALRHAFNTLDLEVDEDHPAAAVWNLMAFITTAEGIQRGDLPRELDDIGYLVALEAKDAPEVGDPGQVARRARLERLRREADDDEDPTADGTVFFAPGPLDPQQWQDVGYTTDEGATFHFPAFPGGGFISHVPSAENFKHFANEFHRGIEDLTVRPAPPPVLSERTRKALDKIVASMSEVFRQAQSSPRYFEVDSDEQVEELTNGALQAAIDRDQRGLATRPYDNGVVLPRGDFPYTDTFQYGDRVAVTGSLTGTEYTLRRDDEGGWWQVYDDGERGLTEYHDEHIADLLQGVAPTLPKSGKSLMKSARLLLRSR